jgi:hypothetical protein
VRDNPPGGIRGRRAPTVPSPQKPLPA